MRRLVGASTAQQLQLALKLANACRRCHQQQEGPAASTAPSGGAELTPAIKGMRVSAFLGGPDPVAVGLVTAKISENVFAVAFDRVPTAARVIEVGSRVYVQHQDGGGGAPPQQAAQAAAAAPPQQQQQQGAGGAAPGRRPQQQSQQQGGNGGGVGSWEGPQAGIVARVNGDGTFAVLLDDGDRLLPSVKRSQIVMSEGKPKFLQTDSYRRIVDWVRLSGVSRRTELESVASILYARGWRDNRMYLLEAGDVHCLSHLNKSVRMGLLEKAEWEREHQRQRREWSKERLKETEWRYVVTKYSGVVSVFVAFCGATSVFMWNLVRWRREQRDFHLNVAAETLSRRVQRPKLQDRAIHVYRHDTDALVHRLQELDPSHPRILVITGPRGCGKSTLCKSAIHKAGMAAVFVDVRGADDVPRAILKSLGVTAIELVGDPMDFIDDACRLAQKHLRAAKDSRRGNGAGQSSQQQQQQQAGNSADADHSQPAQDESGAGSGSTGRIDVALIAHVDASSSTTMTPAALTAANKNEYASQELPCLVLKVRDTSAGIAKVYNEASVLACDRCACNVIVEVDADRISQANLATLPRLDVHYVPPFTSGEAAQYCQRLIDPLALDAFVQVIGTNSSDLDELISFIHNNDEAECNILNFIDVRLSRAARRVRQLLVLDPAIHAGLSHLASHDFEDGAHATNSGPLLDLLTRVQADNVSSVLREMVFHDAARDVLVFSSKAFHTAAQVLLC